MEDIVQVLSSDKYIAPLQYASDGMMAATHLANVKWIDGKPSRFYVKVYPKGHTRGLVNEITGYLLAHAAGLPQPKKVAVIQIPKEVIKENFTGEFVFSGDFAWGWASEECGTTPNTYLKIEDLIGYERCLDDLKRWDQLPTLLAFDDWVANQDRNTGNITIKYSNKFHIIDHGNVPVSECWTQECLDKNRVYINKLLDGLFKGNYPLPLSASMVEESKKHKNVFNIANRELVKWWSILLDDDSFGYLEDFISSRSKISTDKIKSRTGLLVA